MNIFILGVVLYVSLAIILVLEYLLNDAFTRYYMHNVKYKTIFSENVQFGCRMMLLGMIQIPIGYVLNQFPILFK